LRLNPDEAAGALRSDLGPMELRARLPVFTEALALLLVFIAFVTIQVLIGGTRMVFSLPAYLIAGVAGIVAMISLRRRNRRHVACVCS